MPKDWPGMRDDMTEVGSGLSEVVNCSYKIGGEMRRRPGLGDRLTLSATLLGSVEHPSAGAFLLGANAGTITGLKLATAASATVKSGLSSDNRGCFASAAGRAYFTNDFDPVQVIERGDTTCAAAGIAAPAAAPVVASTASGSVTVGTHLIRYRYQNTRTGFYSDPSPALSHTVASSSVAALTLTTVASADSKVDRIVVEMSLRSGREFFQAGTYANGTSCVVNISDTSLGVQTASNIYAPPDGYGHGVPPLSTMLIEHRARLFSWGASRISRSGCGVTNGSPTISGTNFSAQWAGRLVQVGTDTTTYVISSATTTAITLSANYGGSTNASTSILVYSPNEDLLQWSRANYPEGWNASSWARRVLQGTSDRPSAMFSFFGDIYLCGRRSMRRFLYDTDPASGRIISLPGSLGAWNQRCVVLADGGAYGWGKSGAWIIDGVNPKHISKPIDRSVAADMDETQADDFFGFFDPGERVVWWCYTATDETLPRRAFCLDIDSGKWSLRRFRHQVTDALTYGDADRAVRAYVADGDGGYTWVLDEGRFDGLPSTMADGVVTVTGTSGGGTVITVSESLSTSPSLVGAILYNETLDEERRITANTANTITIASAYTTTPANAATLYVGSIYVKLLSEWDVYKTLNDRVRPSRLQLEHVSDDGTVTVRTRVFQDFSASAYVYGTLTADDTQPRGVSDVSTTTKAVDLSVIDPGVPLPAEWSKCLRYEIVQQQPRGTLKLADVRWSVDKDGAHEEVRE